MVLLSQLNLLPKFKPLLNEVISLKFLCLFCECLFFDILTQFGIMMKILFSIPGDSEACSRQCPFR